MNKSLPLSLALAALTAQAFAETPGYVPASPSASTGYLGNPAQSNPSTAPTKFEKVPDGEVGQIAENAALMVQLLQMRYPNSMARRGVHAKDHGCVQAKFTVNPDIPDTYRVGVLATPGKTYETWIRFSNATATLNPDMEKDGPPSRGIAIKLMGVEGTTLLGEPGAKTQDFLLINQPMFAFANVAEYLELTKVQLAHHDDVRPFFAPPLSEDKKNTLTIIGGIKHPPSQVGNPLDSRYFSASPFLFGKDTVAKFGVTPRDPGNSQPTSSPNFMREAMKKSLDPNGGKPAIFDFQVQIRTSDALPIENASAKWDDSESVAPFRNVATITIDPQDFDNAIRSTECEHLVFTPWHGLAEFQPIGGINRLRLGVYAASAKYRAQTQEPAGFPGK